MKRLWDAFTYSYRFGFLRYVKIAVIWGLIAWCLWWVWYNGLSNRYFIVLNDDKGSVAFSTTSKTMCYSIAKEKNLLNQRNGKAERYTCELIDKE